MLLFLFSSSRRLSARLFTPQTRLRVLNATYMQLNRQRSVFPNDSAFLESLFLTTELATKKVDYAFAELGFNLWRVVYYFRGAFTLLTSRLVFFTEIFPHTLPPPHQSWQRGTNENTNDLLRGCFTKGYDFKSLSNEDLQSVVEQLNQRPRKCLGYKTPWEVYFSTMLHLA